MKNPSRIASKRTTPVSAIVVTGAMLLVPAASHAQADQRIVMRCTYDGYTNQTLDYVIDLSARTVSLTHTTTVSGAPIIEHYTPDLTQVADDKIAWTYRYNDGTFSSTETLNRYTGQVVAQIASPGANTTVLMSCQRQQKQF